ncbi:MAG: thiamine pyrophosphate-binding protein [Desulfobacterales bacterium]|nr:MAG: thiamine pyrophosphate-binding protein [Desulfobacterales bacterium]
MRELMNSFIEHRLSRRGFCQALAAMSISVSGVASIVRAAEAAVNGVAGAGRPFTGTGGALMVEQMKAAGVRYLFTNPGSFEVGFFDAFLDQPGVNLILGLHEGIVISMADGYHKVSGEPAFVNVHVIAGTAQSVGQLYNSSRDGSALIVTAGLLDHEINDDEILLAPRPGFNQKDVTQQFTKISWESRDATGLPSMLRRAFKVATTSPGGPVYLAIPNYILEEKNVTADIYDRSAFMIPDDIPPGEDDILALAEFLLNAKNPVLFLGDEVHKAHAQPEAFELAELLRIPVSEFLLPAFHCFPRHHSLFVGPYFLRANQDRDLVLNIGVTDLGGGPIPQPPRLAAGAKEVYIGLNTNAIGSERPFNLAIVANVKLALQALFEAIKSAATKDRISKMASLRSKPERRTPQINNARLGMSPIHPDELAWVMEQELDKDAILVSESFSRSNLFLTRASVNTKRCGFPILGLD